MTRIGENIRKFREEKNLSQEQLAVKIRCGTKKIEDYENGIASPNLDTILKISTVLDIPAAELLAQHDNR